MYIGLAGSGRRADGRTAGAQPRPGGRAGGKDGLSAEPARGLGSGRRLGGIGGASDSWAVSRQSGRGSRAFVWIGTRASAARRGRLNASLGDMGSLGDGGAPGGSSLISPGEVGFGVAALRPPSSALTGSSSSQSTEGLFISL